MSWKHALVGLVGGSMAVAVATGIALAEPKKDQAAPPKMDPQMETMMAEMMKFAAPGPEHKVLEPLIGKWKTATKTWMGPGEPQASEGTAEYAWLLDGRFMTYHGHGSMMGQPAEGFELLGYDRKAKKYDGIWVDNSSTAIFPFSGSYDEATKTLTFMANWPNPMGEGTVLYRMTTKIEGPDQHVFTMYMASGTSEQKIMETICTRAK